MPADYNRKPIGAGRIKRFIDRYRIIIATGRTAANICLQKHIGRKTYYRHINNYASAGLPALLDRPRKSSPKEILTARVRSIALSDPKLDCRKISDRLKGQGIKRCFKTINNILRKEGLASADERIRYCHRREREAEMYQ